jgi:phenylacetate-CoA ligase
MNDRKYFNEDIETLSKSKLKALQLERLQAIVERAYTQNRFYRELYPKAARGPLASTMGMNCRRPQA